VERLKRHWLIILTLAGLIVAGSFYDFYRKTALPEKSPQPETAGRLAEIPAGRAVVHVSGAVNTPGVYKVADGSRVADVVNAAGGLAPGADANRVNLAQPVKDGMQVHVPLSGAPGGRPSAGSEAGKVSVNTADRGELEKLPGIGPVLAQRILDYRQANGPFRNVTELKRISGIGESKFNRIKDRLTL
jgi:competence protein ComEA helix-hairpin-helix repeat region